MITSRFPLGDVSFSAEYFSTLVGEATKQCYGVAAMAPRDLTDRVHADIRHRFVARPALLHEFPDIFHIHIPV